MILLRFTKKIGYLQSSFYNTNTFSGTSILFKQCNKINRKYTQAAQFDVFQRLKDPPDESSQNEDKKRKPSDKVLRLVDEIMNLTLIEAADLCDLCQETLSSRSKQSSEMIPGRTPFPHPSAMFGMNMSAMPFPSPLSSFQPPPPQHIPNPVSSIDEKVINEQTTSNKSEEKKAKKTHVALNLISFEQSKKVAVVKEVRAITKLGLIESKQLVESSPKILKKGIEISEAEELKKKLEAAGAKVELE